MEKVVCFALVILSLTLQANGGPVGTQDFHFHDSGTDEKPCFEEHPENVATSTETPDPKQIANITAVLEGGVPEIQLDYDASRASPAMFEMYDGQTRLLCVIAPPENEVEDAINDIDSLDDLSVVRKPESLSQEQPVNVGNFVLDTDHTEEGRSDPDSEPESEPEPEPSAEPEPPVETENNAESGPESCTETEPESVTTTEISSVTEFQTVAQETESGSEKEALSLTLTSSTEPAPSVLSSEPDDGVAESTIAVAFDIVDGANASETSTNSDSGSRSDIDEQEDMERSATGFLTQTTELASHTTDSPSETRAPLSEDAPGVLLDADAGTTAVPIADDLERLENRQGSTESIKPQRESENIDADQTLRQPENPRESIEGAEVQSDTKDSIESGSEAVETTRIVPIFKKNCNRSSGLRRTFLTA